MIAKPVGAQNLPGSVWESQPLSADVVSVSVGDLDQDSNRDVVLVVGKSLQIYTWFLDGSLQAWNSQKLPRHFDVMRVRILPNGVLVLAGFQQDKVYTQFAQIEQGKFKVLREEPALILPRATGSSDLLWQDYFSQGRWSTQISSYDYQTRKKKLVLKLSKGLASNALSLFQLKPYGQDWMALSQDGKLVQINSQGQLVSKSNLTTGGAPLVHDWQRDDPLGLNNKKWLGIFPQILSLQGAYYVAHNDMILGQRVGARPEIKWSEITTWEKSSLNWNEKKKSSRLSGAITDWTVMTDADGSQKILLSFVLGKGQILTIQKVQSILAVFEP